MCCPLLVQSGAHGCICPIWLAGAQSRCLSAAVPGTGALRETQEEVGLTLSPEDGKLIYSVVGRVVNGVKFTDILDVWLFAYDGPVSLEQAATQEVAQTAWMTKTQIRELFDTGKLVHTLGYFFEMEGL